ncbi:hypothetical protein TWF694_009040 [Orbilia ellipsospora]|uniref:Uncharacterized protein n=1 Tax=Orbilia ellipsospora TaxID=2528407 RepID=A0AAV9XGG1_9PEZI
MPEIFRPATQAIIETVYQKAKLPLDRIVNFRFSDVKEKPENSVQKELWAAMRGIPEILAASEMLYKYRHSFYDAEISAIHWTLQDTDFPIHKGEKSALIVLELQRPEGGDSENNNNNNNSNDDIREPSTESEVSRETIFKKAVSNGKDRWRATLLRESLWHSAEGPDKSLQILPETLFFDYSWTGGQVYPFSFFIETIKSGSPGNRWPSEEQAVSDGATWRKINIMQSFSGGYVGAQIVFRAAASTDEHHFAFWWSQDALDNQALSQWVYQCWAIGSNDQPSQELLEDYELTPLRIPNTYLKYITIWNIENWETIVILQAIYERSGLSLSNVETSFSLIFDEWTPGNDPDDFWLELWDALVGTFEIREINSMCQDHPVGLRKAKISKISFTFHVPPSGNGNPKRASILIELSFDHQYNEEIVAGRPPELKLIEEDLREQASQRLDMLGLQSQIKIKILSTQIVPNPFEKSLKGLTNYQPSNKPSYIELQTIDSIEDERGYSHEYTYRFAMSSTENHLLLESITAPPPKERSRLLVERDIYTALGSVLFSAWFSQEGWSKIAEITFKQVSNTGEQLILRYLGNEGDTSAFINGSDEWEDFIPGFFATTEGNAIGKFIQEHSDFLISSIIHSIEIGRHSQGGPSDIFIFIQFEYPFLQSSLAGGNNQLLPAEDRDLLPPVMIGNQVVEILDSGQQEIQETLRLERSFIVGTNNRDQYARIFSMELRGSHWVTRYVDRKSAAETFLLGYDIKVLGKIDDPSYPLFESATDFFTPENLVPYFIAGKIAKSASYPHFHLSVVAKKRKDYTYQLSVCQKTGSVIMLNAPDEKFSTEDSAKQGNISDIIFAAWKYYWNSGKVIIGTLPSNLPKALPEDSSIAGIRFVSFLTVSKTSTKILNLVYREYSDLVQPSGLLVVSYPDFQFPTKTFLSIFNYNKADTGPSTHPLFTENFSLRMTKLWLTLTGLPETLAVNEVFLRHNLEMDEPNDCPLVVSTIVIVWEKDDGAGANGEMVAKILYRLDKPRRKWETSDVPSGFHLAAPGSRSFQQLSESSPWLTIGITGEQLNYKLVWGGATHRRPDDVIPLDLKHYHVKQAVTSERLPDLLKIGLRSALNDEAFALRLYLGNTPQVSPGAEIVGGAYTSTKIHPVDREVLFEIWAGPNTRLQHLILRQYPIFDNLGDSEAYSFSSQRVSELSEIVFEVWRAHVPALSDLVSAGSSDFPQLELLTLENLGSATIQMINYIWGRISMGSVGPISIFVRNPVYRFTKSRENALGLYLRRPVDQFASWNLLFGAPEVASVAYMLHRYCNSFGQRYIHDIHVVQSSSDNSIRIFLRILPAVRIVNTISSI